MVIPFVEAVGAFICSIVSAPSLVLLFCSLYDRRKLVIRGF